MPSARLAAASKRLAALQNWEKADRLAMKAVNSRACDRLCKALGRPQARLRFVHIAGSKGKGTVATLVGAALESAGFRVCVVTSPHVESIVERLRLSPGLAPIGDDEFADRMEEAADAAAFCEGVTYFDALVAASYQAARRRKCDWCVVECGLGGRGDSTNCVGAEVAALTSVELEHTEVLGDTVSLIAREKAAIASKRGVLVASRAAVPRPARRVAAAVAARRGARFVLAGNDPRKTSPFGASNLGLAKRILDVLGGKYR